MLRFADDLRVYLHREPVDFRCGINTLAAVVENSMRLDPLARAVYAFRNRKCNRIKLLLYERTGFWLLLRRLEQDRFVWPRRDQEVIELTTQQLAQDYPDRAPGSAGDRGLATEVQNRLRAIGGFAISTNDYTARSGPTELIVALTDGRRLAISLDSRRQPESLDEEWDRLLEKFFSVTEGTIGRHVAAKVRGAASNVMRPVTRISWPRRSRRFASEVRSARANWKRRANRAAAGGDGARARRSWNGCSGPGR